MTFADRAKWEEQQAIIADLLARVAALEALTARKPRQPKQETLDIAE